MDSIACAYAPTTVTPAQAPFAVATVMHDAPMLIENMLVQSGQASNAPIGVADASYSVRLLPIMTGNVAARIKGQVSPTPVNTFQGVWSPPPRREPL